MLLGRCRHLSISAVLFVGLLLDIVHAATDTVTLGNSTIERTVQLRTHSLFPPYIDQDLQNRWWDFGGDAYVNTNKHVRLTRARPSQLGWLWSRLPLTATNWVIEVEFKISSDASVYGDGLAIWLTTKRAEPGPIYGSVDKFNGLGVFLDTFANSRHSYAFPRILAVLGDGETEYDYSGDGDSQSLGACSANFRRTNVVTKLKLTYLKDKFLDVKLQHKAWDEWTDCFTLSPISLHSAPFLGFSAMTGELFDAHDIISVTTYSAVLSKDENPLNKLNTGKSIFASTSSSGSWIGFFFKLFLFVGVCAGAYYAYQQYAIKNGYYRGPDLSSFYLSNGKRF